MVSLGFRRVLAFTLVSVSLMALTLLSIVSATTGSVVGTSTALGATQYSNSRKTFYAAGLNWVWYSDGTNLVFSTSANGFMGWSPTTSVGACANGNAFSVWFDSTYVYYARYASYKLYYRRGTPNSNGTITWSAESTVYSGTSSNYHRYPMITVDSNGYAWIGTMRYDGTKYTPYIFKDNLNNGSWATATGFPYQFSTTSSSDWMVSVVPLANGKVYAIYSYGNGTVGFGNLWNGSSWNGQENTMANAYGGYSLSAVSDSNDNIYLVYLKNTSTNGICYHSRNYATGLWSTDTTIQARSTSSPVLSIDTSTNNLYCFWENTSNYIYVKKYTSSTATWDINPTAWDNETSAKFASAHLLSCSYQAYNYIIGVEYTTRTASPYNVKYAFINLPPLNPGPNTPTNLSPSTRQTTTSVTISAYDNDDFGNSVTVYFYDNSNGNLIGSQSVGTGGTASVVWSGLTSGNTYVFYAMGRDNNGSWSNRSATCSFGINTPILINGNAQFISANGVTGGSGTQIDPYIIENWVISASSANGIYILNTTSYFIVRNCFIENVGYPYSGIYFYNVINGTIENNFCDNNIYRYGICLSTSSNYNTVENNTCNTNYEGIRLDTSSNNNIVAGNICKNNSYEGIYLGSLSNYNTVENNTCENDWDGIWLDNSCFNTVTYNTCANNNHHGLPLEFFANNNIISNNTVENNPHNGIYLVVCSNNIISNNICNNNSPSGIFLGTSSLYPTASSDNNILDNNICMNNDEDGIFLGTNHYNTVSNNICSNNTINGIWVYQDNNDTIENNTCNNNFYGIELGSSSYNDILSGNTCLNNSYGIGLYSSFYDNLISNTIQNNSSYGIYLSGSSSNILTLNYLLANLTNGWDNSTNAWDNSGKGNYWSDWQPPNHPDVNHDWVVDTAYVIPGGTSQDNYPLVFENFTPPNTPTNLSPSTRQTTTSVTISAYDNDDFGNSVTVYFYDNSNGNLIGSQSVGTGGTASVTWGGLASGNTYTFYAMGQDNIGLWSNRSVTCSFGINTPILINHTPILINGNVQFTSANGVNGGGTGTVSNPYIIENWVISASSADGIYIQNTTAYFIVRNCVSENGGSVNWYNGIYLYNVTNGTIENNTCDNSREGIELYSSPYCVVSNNRCSKNIDCGIQLWVSSHDNVTGNVCENSYADENDYGGYGIAVEKGSEYNILSNNNFSNNSYGILLYPTSSYNPTDYNTISNNICNNNDVAGIYVSHSFYNTFDNNTCNYNNIWGFYLYNNSAYDNLTRNTCNYNDYGIQLTSSSHINLISNTCDNNTNDIGIYLYTDNYCNLSNNICNNNSYGIYLSHAPYNNLAHNTCNNNSIYGIAVYNSSNYNNCINGTSSGNAQDIHIGSGSNYNVIDLFWTVSSNSGTGNVVIKPPNKPTSLSPSTRQTTTSPTISAYDNDNYSTSISGITVYFYDNSSGGLIGSSVISKTGGTASTTWGGRTRGNTYTFFAVGQDNYGAWSSNSNTQTFKVNSLSTVPTSLSLSPSTIYVGTTLTATAGGSTDADGDTITYYYRFYNQTDGVERQGYSTTNSYTIQQADSLDNIVVSTKAYDGYEYSGEKDNTITVMPTQYYLTVTSPYDTPTPASGWFDNGTIITETVTSLVPGGSGTQYVCTGWTGTGSVSTSGTGTSVTFTITAPSSITWNWKTQYYLTLTTSPSVGASLIGAGWYDSGYSAAISTDNIVPIDSGSRYRFNGWTTDNMNEIADASLAYTTVTMDSAKTVTANYVMQYYLTVTSPYGTTGGDGWYDNGTTANATVTPLIVSGPPGVQYVFTNWSGDATGTTSPSDSITMNAPKTAIANWETQYF